MKTYRNRIALAALAAVCSALLLGCQNEKPENSTVPAQTEEVLSPSQMYWVSEAERVVRENPYDSHQQGVVFYGASNFRMWFDMKTDLADYNVANCGFGGSTDKLLVKYAEELLYPYHPLVVFFQTGSNDYIGMPGTEEENVAACMEFKDQMFSAIHERLPEAQLVVMSGLLLPGRAEYCELTQEVNRQLEQYCQKRSYMTFVDSSELTYDGEAYHTALFNDDLIHLNHDGQLAWRDGYILPVLHQLEEKYPGIRVSASTTEAAEEFPTGGTE